MSGQSEHFAPKQVARLAGGLYIAYILVTVAADLIGHIGIGSASQVVEVIVASPLRFRAGLVVAFVSALLFLATAWALYVMLRPVNSDLALLFLLLNAVGVGIQCASMLPLISGILLSDPAGGVHALTSAQSAGLALLSAGVYKTGFITAQLFFGTWLFPLGYLVYRSGFLPRFLGVLLLLDGVAVMIWFLQALLLPAYPAISTPGLAVSFVAEAGLGLWLLFRGVKTAPGEPAAV